LGGYLDAVKSGVGALGVDLAAKECLDDLIDGVDASFGVSDGGELGAIHFADNVVRRVPVAAQRIPKGGGATLDAVGLDLDAGAKHFSSVPAGRKCVNSSL